MHLQIMAESFLRRRLYEFGIFEYFGSVVVVCHDGFVLGVLDVLDLGVFDVVNREEAL